MWCGETTHTQVLEALREHFVGGQRGVDHGGAGAVVVGVAGQLVFELLHLVVVEVLLHQVALPLHARLHLRRDVRDQPGHEVLDQEDHVLQERGQGQLVSLV